MFCLRSCTTSFVTIGGPPTTALAELQPTTNEGRNQGNRLSSHVNCSLKIVSLKQYLFNLLWSPALSFSALLTASRNMVMVFSAFSSSRVFSASFPLSVSTFCCHFLLSSHRATPSVTTAACKMNSYSEVCLQGIMVVVFIILDCIFALMNTTTMIPCWRVL